MQHALKPRHLMRTALLWGLVFGVIIEIIVLIIDVLNNTEHFTTSIAISLSSSNNISFAVAINLVNILYSALNLLIVAIFGCIAGPVVVKKTGRRVSGLFAGLYTGTTFGIAHLLVTIFNVLVFTLPLSSGAHNTNLATFEQQVISYVIIQNVLILILAAFVGTVFGTLGGSVRKRSQQVATQPSQARS